MSKIPHDHHKDGQGDRSKHRGYSPPHGLLENALTWSREGCKKMAKDNWDYKAGWNNAGSQRKR